MYPIKFKKCFIDKVWGGRAFETVLGMTLPENRQIGESWEVSSHKNGMSVVENGIFKDITLENLVEKYGAELLGKDVSERFSGKFPLLIMTDFQFRFTQVMTMLLKLRENLEKANAGILLMQAKTQNLFLGLKVK